MKAPLLFWLILQGSHLVFGQAAGGAPQGQFDLQTVLQANEERMAACQTLSAEVEFEYFGPKSNMKTSTKYDRKLGRERFVSKNARGNSDRVVTKGIIYSLNLPLNGKREEGDPPGGGTISRFPLEIEMGNGYTPVFLNDTIPWNLGCNLKQAVSASDTDVEFSIKKAPDGKACPVIMLRNKDGNNNNINGKGEYNAIGYNEEDNTNNRYDLEVWFSPDHNYSISRSIFIGVAKKEVFGMVVVDQFREVKKGVFFPEKCSQFTRDTQQKKLILIGKGHLTRAIVDAPIAEEVFALKFPQGTPVTDFTINKVWYANKEGKFEHYLQNAYGFPAQIVGGESFATELLFAVMTDPVCFFCPTKKH